MWNRTYSKWQEKIDTEVSSLGERVAGINSTMQGINKGLGDLVKSFNIHNQLQQEATKPPYMFFIGAITLVVIVVGGIIGAFSSGYVRDITRIEATQLREANHVYLHEVTFGHPALTQKVDMLLTKTDNLDISLQREMRLLNDTITVRINELDKRLQREMELREKVFRVTVEDIKYRIRSVSKWQENYDNIATEIHATQKENLRALEREVFGNRRKVD
jgi:hypothetical protein